MTQHLHQISPQADIVQNISASTTKITRAGLKDIEDMSPDAQYVELNELSNPFPSGCGGTRPQCTTLYLDEILELYTEEPESNQSSAATHCLTFTSAKVDSRVPEDSLLPSSVLVPCAIRNFEQTAMIKIDNGAMQQVVDLISKLSDKMTAMQWEVIKYGITFASAAVPALTAVNASRIIDIIKDPLKADIDISI
ncbi:hypothetical protein BGZ98_000728, partial [Dissophora globulifera]